MDIENSAAHASPRARVFISYSRKNIDVAERLVSDLQAHRFEAYLDKRDILPGEPWKERLRGLLESADAVVFLISPDSIASHVCDWEVNEAERLTKRLLPVVVRDVPDDQVPARLKRLNYVFLRESDDRTAELAKLTDALSTDIDWIREHTRMTEIVSRWDAGGRPTDQLLRGSDIQKVEQWAARRPQSVAGLTPSILDFINASRAEANAEQVRELGRQRREVLRSRIITWGSLAAAAILLVLGWFFFQSSQQALRSQSEFLADLALKEAGDGDSITGMLLALEGLRDPTGSLTQWLRPYVAQTEFALDRAMRKARERLVFNGHDKPVESAVFSADGRRVLSRAEDAVLLWDATTGKVQRKLSGDGFRSAVFSPDGTRILTASAISRFTKDYASKNAASKGVARIWDATTGAQIASFDVPEIINATFSPDGKLMVIGSFDKTAKVIDVATATVKLTLQHESWIDSAVFSADGALILTASSDKGGHLGEGVFRIWDATTGALVLMIKGPLARSAAFSPDGARIVTAGLDHIARVWDAKTGRELLRLEGHTSQVSSASFSADGTRIITGSFDMTTRIWDASGGKLLQTFSGNDFWVMGAALSPDGRKVVTASADRIVRLWDAVEVHDLPIYQPLGSVAATYGVSLSSDGERIVGYNIVADDYNSSAFDLWSTQTGEALGRLKCMACNLMTAPASVSHGHVIALAFDGDVRDLDSGATLVRLGVQFDYTTKASIYSPNGQSILVAAKNTVMTLYDAKTGKEKRRLDHRCAGDGQCAVTTVAFSPDSRRIVAGATDKTARIWNVDSGRQLVTLTGPDDVKSVAFSPDGTKVLTASGPRAQVWDVQSGKLLNELRGHDNNVQKAIFDFDGERIATASIDGTARVWDAVHGNELYRLDVGAIANGVLFLDGGRRLITTSSEKVARMWNIPLSTDDLISQAKARVTRCLTQKQRQTFHLTSAAPAWCRELGKWPYDAEAKGE